MTRQDSMLSEIRLLGNKSHCEVIVTTDHTKDAHTSSLSQLLDSYHHHLFLTQLISTLVWSLFQDDLLHCNQTIVQTHFARIIPSM